MHAAPASAMERRSRGDRSIGQGPTVSAEKEEAELHDAPLAVDKEFREVF